jgi:hypothetical protein
MYSKFGNRVSYCWRQHNDRRKGRSGRLGIYYGRDLDHTISGAISAEYCVLDPVYLLGGRIEFRQDEDPLSISIWVWPFSLYLRVDTPVAKRIARRLTTRTWGGEREVAVHISPRSERATVRWSLWHPVHSWHSNTPRWRNGSWDLLDAVLGRRDMRWESIETVTVSIPMPERSYEANIEMRDHVSWRRRMSFRTQRHRCANVAIPGGIGHPGKGENAWDCGDDATFGMSCPAQTVEEAIGKVVASIYRDRKRYGGSYTFTPMDIAL